MTGMQQAPALDPPGGWQASLQIGFARRGEKTVLVHNRHRGPLRLQRPLYPEPSVCHGLILHPPGGVVGGDRLHVAVDVQNDAAALVTTPGAAKFYRSGGLPATQTSVLGIEAGGCLEWLPQETIIYPGADAGTTTRVNLDAQAGFIGWEILCLGLPACSHPFSVGRLTARLELNRRGRPLLHDHLMVNGAAGIDCPATLRGFTVSATLAAVGVDAVARDAIRTRMDGKTDMLWGATLLDDLLIVRVLGHDSATVKQAFQEIWAWLRPRLFGRPACPPRIWDT